MKTRILTIILITFCSNVASAQWQLGIGGIGLGPVDRFDSSVYKPGGGFFVNLTSQSLLPEDQPYEIRFGLYLDYMESGTKKFDVDLADPITEQGQTKFRNSSIGNHLMTRFGYKINPKVTVFTDGIIGHRKFISETVTGVKGGSEEYEDAIERIFTSRTFRYGVGVGTRFNLGKSFGIEVRADYTRGNEASYFDMDNITETATSIEYESETWPHSDLFVYGVAVNWKLFRSTSSGYENTTTTPGSYTPSPSPTYRTTPRRTRTRTTSPKKPKKTVTPKKDIKKKKEVEPISW
jgi:hypothetical protein